MLECEISSKPTFSQSKHTYWKHRFLYLNVRFTEISESHFLYYSFLRVSGFLIMFCTDMVFDEN